MTNKRKVSELEKASEKLGTVALEIFEWFKGKHKADNENRNNLIIACYDYLKVQEKADSNSDNHSFSGLSDLIFGLVGLDEREHHDSYFRKFANNCVKGGLLLHWQDIKKDDDDGTCIVGLQFAKKNSVNWQKTFKTKKIGDSKKRVSFRHNIIKGDLIAPYSLIESMVSQDNDKVENTDDTLLLVGNNIIQSLYKRFKDTSTQELSDDITAEKIPAVYSCVEAMKVLNDMLFDLTKDDSKTKSAFIDKDFIKGIATLKENLTALETINNNLNVDDAEGGKNDYWTTQKKENKKLVGTAQLTELKKTMEGK